MTTPKNSDDYEAVETLEDFVDYLLLLAKDVGADQSDPTSGEGWAHTDLEEYFDAFAAWAKDNFLSGRHMGHDLGVMPEGFRPEPSWKTFAWMLWAAGGYE